jgi:hypothetical protein
MDEATYVVYLETYAKSDCEDLDNNEYKILGAEAEIVLSQPLLYDWT